MLESEVINAYLSLLTKNYAGKAYVIDSFQATNIWKGNGSSMKRLDPDEFDVMIGSINENHHWTLLVIYPKEWRILYINSFGESRSKLLQCEKAISKFMDTRGKVGKWKCSTVPHCFQQDGNSCGVFVCKFAEAILTGGSLQFASTADNIALLRQQIGLCLLQGSDDLSELCLTCGDQHSFTEDIEDCWIQCDCCSGWFHWECVNQPSLSEIFICHGCRF
ncbi:sentrin-specific protease 2-like [Paramisgurnus dabryanus]|uniref:sentrin-specific protease 2-like n=1 Tax=Paramisgurnus dabryanus TaxID=90735 RepID=UPI0031F3FB75